MHGNYKKYQIGSFSVTRVFEKSSTAGSPQYLLPDWTPAAAKKHEHWLIPGSMGENHEYLIRSIHTWVIKTDRHTILVDAGIGNDKERPHIPAFHRLASSYLDRLQAVGVTPEDVDYVFLTHLHADHVGWNTRLVDGTWVPTFPNARYVFSQAEDAAFAKKTDGNEINDGVYEDSVLPIIKAGLADRVIPDGSPYLEGIALHSAPGHSMGHMAISLTSQGEQALFGGDVMHHPLQVYYPEWNSCFCENAQLARTSRRWLLDYAAERRAILFSGHFAESSAGVVRKNGHDFQWEFL